MDCKKTIKAVKNSIALILLVNDKNKVVGKGSAFVFSDGNTLVTCKHVVSGSEEGKIIAVFPDDPGAFIDASVVITDNVHDLALLKIEGKKRVPLVQGKVDDVEEGMEVIFGGYPLQLLDFTTHQGILSSIVTDPTGVVKYMIDGTVNPGNSGCPLMNCKGEVIGIVNATKREEAELLDKVKELQTGAVAIHGIDLVALYKALISNLQLGMGFAIPVSYIPKPGSATLPNKPDAEKAVETKQEEEKEEELEAEGEMAPETEKKEEEANTKKEAAADDKIQNKRRDCVS